MVRHGCQVLQLRLGLLVLRHVHVHFITVKIGVIRLGVADIHAKGVALTHDARNVTHHAHAMQSGLTVEKHAVAVHHVAVHDVAVVKHDVLAVGVSQRNALAALALQNLRTGVLLGSVAHEAHQKSAIHVVHNDRLRDVLRNLQRDTELSYGKIGIGRNDGTRGEIHALAHEVAAHATALAV